MSHEHEPQKVPSNTECLSAILGVSLSSSEGGSGIQQNSKFTWFMQVCIDGEGCIACPSGSNCGVCPSLGTNGEFKFCSDEGNREGSATCGDNTCTGLCNLKCGLQDFDPFMKVSASNCNNNGAIIDPCTALHLWGDMWHVCLVYACSVMQHVMQCW